VVRLALPGGGAILDLMARIKTRPTDHDVDRYLAAIPDERKRSDAQALREMIERVTGAPATMWGPSMIGFGSQPYTNTTGTNDWFIVGFAPRKSALTIYGVHDGYGPVDPLLDELGPHTTGKGCLYVKRLGDVDETVLERLVRQAWDRAANASLRPSGE
jgi:hypothetical protein